MHSVEQQHHKSQPQITSHLFTASGQYSNKKNAFQSPRKEPARYLTDMWGLSVDL